MRKENKLAIYQNENWEIQINFDQNQETFWLDIYQIANIFWRDRTVIQKHIRAIYKNNELDENTTCAKNAQVQKEWNRKVKREVKFYNLDVVLAVWYKTNSQKATQFRKWATWVLKQHITQGWTINNNVIQKNYNQFMKAVQDLKSLSSGKDIWSDEVLELITSFANTWFGLESFDKWDLPNSWYTKKDLKIEIESLYKDIETLKKDLMQKDLASSMFAQEKSKWNLEWILGNVMQSSFWQDLYPTIEEKAANLLYFIIKTHPFNDGNKRTWAFAFVWFLKKYNYDFSQKITPEALTSLTLLVAQSDPKDKDKMIWLILLLLNNDSEG